MGPRRIRLAPEVAFDSDRVTTSAPIDLRFPGQWFQTEAGLHQNWMRDYDPATGRYMQADPLGLVDGASVYGYARQNPGRWTDPTGEFIWIVPIVAGIILDQVVEKLEALCDQCDDNSEWKYTVLGMGHALFGPYSKKPFRGFGSGSRTSYFSMALHKSGLSHSSGTLKGLRYLGRRSSRAIPGVGLAGLVYDLYQLRGCVFKVDVTIER